MDVAVENEWVRLANGLPEAAKDIKLNLKSILQSENLAPDQAWGVALACAYLENPTPLVKALRSAGADYLDDAAVGDAQSAAALMSMNNVYYRFRHVIGKDVYQRLPARLRMTRIARPAGDKMRFELFCLAVSAINGCEACVRSHEEVLANGGMEEEAIHDAIRIAAVVRAGAVALRMD